MTDSNAHTTIVKSDFREKIAKYVSLGVLIATGVIGIAGFTYAFLLHGNGSADEATNIFQYTIGALLPLWGTWIGTILAYYFSKENFEAANRSVEKLVNRVTSDKKLASITVREVMIPLEQISFYVLKSTDDPNQVLLQDLLSRMREQEVSRLPIVDEKKRIRYIIHRSTFDSFIAEKALEGQQMNPPQPMENLSLGDLIKHYNESTQKMLDQSFGVVAESANLKEAQQIMAQKKHCQDVFVTVNGSPDEPIIGWVTNSTISKNARV